MTGEPGPAPPADGSGAGAPGWDAPWTVLDAAVAFLAGLVVAELLRAGLAVALPADAYAVAAPLVGGLGLIAGVLAWVALRHGGALPRLLGPGRLRAAVVLKGAGHGVVAFVVLNLGAAALFTLVAETLGVELPPVQESLRELLTDPERAAVGLVYTLSIAVLAEELFFRGLLYPAFRGPLGRWPAILAVGAVFGVVHYQPDPLAWGYTFAVMAVFGAYLAWAFDRYRHLGVVVAMHVVFNALAVVAILGVWE